MSKIKGGDAMLFVEGKSISYATSHTLHLAGETQDTSNKDEGGGGWASSEVSIISWDASSDNFYSTDGQGNNFDTLFSYMVNKTIITGVFGVKSSSDENVPAGGWSYTTPYYKGNCVINDLSLNAPVGEYATFTAQLQGVGPLTRITT